eukprot:TRINITY_DN10117_c0_g1_i4.p1 TRINITY_DN10117_c0_g1~~TRINITY_DN10117_c0_g1_i4.p1  ORF type:complete len:1357 (-),score=309.77 TRINITY_DN10117_c0_g1_i4:1162-4926(-)
MSASAQIFEDAGDLGDATGHAKAPLPAAADGQRGRRSGHAQGGSHRGRRRDKASGHAEQASSAAAAPAVKASSAREAAAGASARKAEALPAAALLADGRSAAAAASAAASAAAAAKPQDSEPQTGLMYGMQVFIVYNPPKAKQVKDEFGKKVDCHAQGCYFGMLNKERGLEFTTDFEKKAFFYVRPPADSSLQGCVRWNQGIVLANSEDKGRSAGCGWYGCLVAYLGGGSEMLFDQGRENPATFNVRVLPEPGVTPKDGDPSDACVQPGEEVVLAMSNDKGYTKLGWYGGGVAKMDSADLRMRLSTGGREPQGFLLKAAPEKPVVDEAGVCEGRGTIDSAVVRAAGLDGNNFVGQHADADACKTDCLKRGAFYFSFKFDEGQGHCRCGKKSKSFAWLLSKASPTLEPWFTKERLTPCDESDPSEWCTQGTKCKRCMLVGMEDMEAKLKRKHKLGDCKKIVGDNDCTVIPPEKGEWFEVKQRQCFQSCQLDAFDGMNTTEMGIYKIGMCAPLMSWNRSACEEWTRGKWVTVAKGMCGKPESWSVFGHFEDMAEGQHTTWKFNDGAFLKKTAPSAQQRSVTWAEFQPRCDISPKENEPGTISVMLPTGPEVDYTLIFQAAVSKDHDGDSVALGTVTIGGEPFHFATGAVHNAIDRFEWSTISVAFVAKRVATQVIFSTHMGQCLLLREVMVSKGKSFYKRRRGERWKDDSALTLAFNRMGCINRNISEETLETWRNLEEVKATHAMWQRCEGSRGGTVGDQQVCCGKGRLCTPRSCTTRPSVEEKPGEWTKWEHLRYFEVAQSSDRDAARLAKNAIDGKFGDKCSQTKSEGTPWWKVTLKKQSHVRAVRLHHSKDCQGTPGVELQVKVDDQACNEQPVFLTAEGVLEVPCDIVGSLLTVQMIMYGSLGLAEVEVQLGGRTFAALPSRCPYELNPVNFEGTGNKLTGYMEQGQFLRTVRRLRRPITLEAEIKADEPKCFVASVFPTEGQFISGYALQTGEFGSFAVGSPGASLRRKMGSNTAWTKVKMEVFNDGTIMYYVNETYMFRTRDTSRREGHVQFAAPCTGGYVRNVYMLSRGECVTDLRSCPVSLKLDQGRDHWLGDGNKAFMILGKGQYFESKASFVRPLRVRAELKGSRVGCISMQLFGGDLATEGSDVGYELSTGIRRYKARLEPGGKEINVGQNNKWHWVEIFAEANGNVSYYLNHVLIGSVEDSTRNFGSVRIRATCTGAEVRNVVAEFTAGCHEAEVVVQDHERW